MSPRIRKKIVTLVAPSKKTEMVKQYGKEDCTCKEMESQGQ